MSDLTDKTGKLVDATGDAAVAVANATASTVVTAGEAVVGAGVIAVNAAIGVVSSTAKVGSETISSVYDSLTNLLYTNYDEKIKLIMELRGCSEDEAKKIFKEFKEKDSPSNLINAQLGK